MCAGRSERLKVMLSPWRQDGGHILLLPQRGIGPPGVAQPRDWLSDIQRRLGKRKIHVRKHPGTDKTAKPLQEDLQDARCAIVWGSGAGLKALCAGVPVFYDFPKWIGRFAASRDLMRIDDSDLTAAMGDRHAIDLDPGKYTFTVSIPGGAVNGEVEMGKDQSWAVGVRGDGVVYNPFQVYP